MEKLLEGAEKALRIQKPDDWYRVTLQQLKELRIAHLLKRKGEGMEGREGVGNGMTRALSRRYPNVKWDVSALVKRY